MACGTTLLFAVALSVLCLLQYGAIHVGNKAVQTAELPAKRTELLTTCFVQIVYPGLFFDPEDGGDILLTNMC
jgi:hypothetical protein